MTIKERFEAVKNKELRTKLLANYDPEYASSVRCDGNCPNDESALAYGFTWRNSPEGHPYWEQICKYMLNKYMLNNSDATIDDAFTAVHGNKTSADTIKHAGFKSPAVHARKDDPRGKEYGYFIVIMDTDKYTVTKFDYVNTIVWAATFSEDSFLAWARDYT